MDIKELLNKIDSLLHESKLSEAEKLMKAELDKAIDRADDSVALTLLNELTGFYRDTGRFQKSIDCCIQSEQILDRLEIGNTKERASAYLNTANAYRANHDLDDAFGYYKKAFEIIEICGDASLYAAYYNNMSLLHQEAGKFDEAEKCLRQALIIADEKLHDELRVAISRTNLATSLLRMKRADEAIELLGPAMEFFKGKTPSDFHYCAALSAYGDAMLAKAKLKEAAEYFEAALSEIELHMGKNNFYEIVSDNLETVYKMMGGRPEVKGLEICEKYFKAFGEPVIKANFSHLMESIACGLFGEGSECLGFDDDISSDHDFGPSFCILIKDDVSEEDAEKLRRAYNLLPKSYMGYKRLETKEAVGRVGVIRLSDYLKKVTGFNHLPKGVLEWQETQDENLIMGINGQVFMDESGFLMKIRKYLRSQQPHYVYFKKLAMQLELMAKHGQYGFVRAVKRSDMTAALIAKSEFLMATMRVCHIICGKYAPYSKWLRKSMDNLTYFKDVACLIDELSVSNDSDKDENIIETICKKIKASLETRSLSGAKDSYLSVAAMEIIDLANRSVVADSIVDMEWAMFDKTENAGGRAGCQDDWGTFSKMRRSQYYTWPMQLLQLLNTDFMEAMKAGRNVITEKYGYMMESTTPAEFAKIKDLLPAVDEDKKNIINAITSIQVGWMEDFAAEYPKMASQARSIHTSEDNEYNTSYETYLRGELSTYHPDSLGLYGRFIAQLQSEGINLARRIMNMTAFLYGYESLEECNAKS